MCLVTVVLWLKSTRGGCHMPFLSSHSYIHTHTHSHCVLATSSAMIAKQ